MSTTVAQLMAQGVVVASPEHTVDYVKRQVLTLDIHAVPVADADGKPLGIVRSRDLLRAKDDQEPVSKIMDRDVVTIEKRAGAETAAHLMQRRRSRQLVVVDGGKIVGILSAFDLLALVAEGTAEFTTGVIDLKSLRAELSGD